MSSQTPKTKKLLKSWEESGWRIEESSSVPGRIRRLPWSHMVDRLKYDVIVEADKLTMPVLLIVGGADDTTPYEHQELFYRALKTKKELHAIEKANHVFTEEKQLLEIKRLISKWIDSLD